MDKQQPPRQEQVEELRPYLMAIARLQIEQKLQAKIDASDIVQQTMLEAHRGIENFRGKSPEELRGWLRAIMSRNMADEIRKFRRGKRNAASEQSIQNELLQSSIGLERLLESPVTGPESAAVRNESLAKLAKAIESLAEDQRTVVILHHLEGLSAAEIGRRLSKTEIAVAGLLRRGMKHLRITLNPASYEAGN